MINPYSYWAVESVVDWSVFDSAMKLVIVELVIGKGVGNYVSNQIVTKSVFVN